MFEPFAGFFVGVASGVLISKIKISWSKPRGRPRKSTSPLQQFMAPKKKRKPLVRDDELAWKMENGIVGTDAK